MHLLIAAAGSGKRMGANCNKLLLKVAGRSVLAWTLDAVKRSNSISWIGIVGQPSDKEAIVSIFDECALQAKWINGGDSRQESVQLGLEGLPLDAKHVLIHDGARCLVEPELFDKCSEMLRQGVSVIAATPVIDTIKKVSLDGFINKTFNRAELWAAQTPQGFNVEQLRQGHKKALVNNWTVTDDASLFEKLGWPVKILESSPSNIKVTTPFDLLIADALLSSRGAD
ncbi:MULTISPECIES: 2-C-methyl-D-erythritol 4-phosphate cytidylyltransferase [Prochlorococcus]|uniref:2-C-methyl-D-erythritol 4-phosphate cytidylyltransferase n=1 Tax=Prochlorococcus marinus (strain SARG / CCMP1375 / SS120) TaxID=167539 RepID=ISPD_PROMA|nr:MULTISPECIES: 2-C-methyl-D-erythritol 4-phosphate cytidylyltransferase [Prochlorococcus]Q7VDC7.1 RecName: Full=2-C-methyl-D-erythritol 4-phosphate cytidylyltransferase; AltName: Full=4-diphosphocytidyl-2C-methyl-D-erythritol synthase; AltName: Full=MEP cytidylyltransferase; Short=MCT [Prochlorococcus marinus subsp. marinus str. CCMP1375]AAP99499.1 4-diphosphocytidyl-2-methyl-D-erithritol synthase [Prochlorococcus marinus subsp. marinus str. CCMP1375]KGG11229.1 2-C-methyl-D-erythritol 4-phosph